LSTLFLLYIGQIVLNFPFQYEIGFNKHEGNVYVQLSLEWTNMLVYFEHKFLLSNLNYKYNKNYGTREYIIANLGWFIWKKLAKQTYIYILVFWSEY
jgi:hypothetical protein